jgi:hypothetical protein
MAEMLVVKHQMMVSNRSFEDYGWGAHCRGLVELPVAAGPAIRGPVRLLYRFVWGGSISESASTNA